MKTYKLKRVIGATCSVLSERRYLTCPSKQHAYYHDGCNIKSMHRIVQKHPSRESLKCFALSSTVPLDRVFCRKCGNRMILLVPSGDTRERHTCKVCGYIDYQNPKIVVGCLTEYEDKILLCSRGIQPRKGLWTIPAGFQEIGESTAAGAMRETLEEANAHVAIMSVFSMMDVPVIGQSHIIFRARLLEPFTFSPGHETLETKLFDPDDIPFDQIAFSSMSETLKAYVRDWKSGEFRFHHGVIVKEPGAALNDPTTFKLEDYIVH